MGMGTTGLGRMQLVPTSGGDTRAERTRPDPPVRRPRLLAVWVGCAFGVNSVPLAGAGWLPGLLAALPALSAATGNGALRLADICYRAGATVLRGGHGVLPLWGWVPLDQGGARRTRRVVLGLNAGVVGVLALAAAFVALKVWRGRGDRLWTAGRRPAVTRDGLRNGHIARLCRNRKA